ncbi:MAG: molybdopterin-binding oxidoreductase, partial [Streptosporangiales bacterium]|nr:molybdopterin-binding oxidoreductase [Streptosporangiales bacterium]
MITKRNLIRVRHASRGGLAGLLAAAAALGVAELAAGITGPLSSPVLAVGAVAIDLTPVPVKDFAIAHFGSSDKAALETGILVLLAVYAMLIGVLALRRLALGLAGLAVFGALGVSAALTRPASGLADALPSLAGTAVAAGALVVLIRTVRRRGDMPESGAGEAGRPGRRGFLVAAGVTALTAVVTGGGGDLLLRRFSAASARSLIRLPGAAVQ